MPSRHQRPRAHVPTPKAARPRSFRPAVERLEDRRLLTTTLTFEDQAVGTTLTSQYHGQGVDFLDPNSGGDLLPVVALATYEGSGPRNQVANISTGPEFAIPGVVGRFTVSHQHVQVDVGVFAAPFARGSQAHLTLRAWDNVHAAPVVQTGPVAVTEGAGFGTLLAVDSPTANLVKFEVTGGSQDGGAQVGIDNLSYDDPQTAPPPDFSLAPTTQAVQVAPGASATDSIQVAGLNNASGPVLLTVSGLPQGVTAGFAPDPAAVGSSSVLVVTAAPGAALTGSTPATVTVTAVPLAASAGTTAHTLQLALVVRPNYTVGVEGVPLDQGVPRIDLPASTPVAVTVDVTRQPGFTDPVTLGLSGLPAGVSVTFAPAVVGPDPAGGLISRSRLTLTAAQRMNAVPVTLTGADGLQGSTALLHLNGVDGTLTAVTPLQNYDVVTGALLPPVSWSGQAGSQVQLTGTGFSPGSQVQFGNADAIAAPTSIGADGRSLIVNVPALATDGPVTVLPPAGMGAPIVSAASVHVESFRDTNGFSFPNFNVTNQAGVSGPYTFNDAQELFGYANTHLPLPVPIADPLADLGLLIINAALVGEGNCFGFGLASQRLVHGTVPLNTFPGTGGTVWGRDGPTVTGNDISNVNDAQALVHFIHEDHLAQFSAEYLAAYKTDLLAHSVPGYTSADLYNELLGTLRSHDGPLIAIRQDFGLAHLPQGHVLVAYDVELGTQADFYIDVYDPNTPYRTGEDPLTPTTSRIHVTSDGHWSFPLLQTDPLTKNPWNGGLDSIAVVPYGAVPTSLTPPWTLLGLTMTVFGSSWATSQVADGAGHTLLQSDGTLNHDPATRLPGAVPYSPLNGPGPGAALYLLDGQGSYTQTITGTGTGNYSAALVGNNLVVRLDTTTTPGVNDAVTVNAQAGTVTFHGGSAGKPVTLQIGARAADGSERTFTVTTTSYQAGGDTFSLDATRQNLQYTHAGPDADVTVTMTGVDAHGQALSQATPTLHVGGGDSVAVGDAGWQQASAVPPPPSDNTPPAPLPAPTPAAPAAPAPGKPHHKGHRRRRPHHPVKHGGRKHHVKKADAGAVARPDALSAAAVDAVFADRAPGGTGIAGVSPAGSGEHGGNAAVTPGSRQAERHAPPAAGAFAHGHRPRRAPGLIEELAGW